MRRSGRSTVDTRQVYRAGAPPLIPYGPVPNHQGVPLVPLEFLKRRSGEASPADTPSTAPPIPEEVSAQDYILKLYYAGKSSEGVRFKAGPRALDELPSMLVGLAQSEIEVVEPLPIEFSQATPTIVRPSEAMQWLNAHHVHSPITRHASRRPRVDRRDRPGLRHVRLRAARR